MKEFEKVNFVDLLFSRKESQFLVRGIVEEIKNLSNSKENKYQVSINFFQFIDDPGIYKSETIKFFINDFLPFDTDEIKNLCFCGFLCFFDFPKNGVFISFAFFCVFLEPKFPFFCRIFRVPGTNPGA
jgi:hypothetical protein